MTISALHKIMSDPDEDFSWQEQANCRGVNPDLFFPGRGESDREAKAVCAGCTVREECLDYAIRTKETAGVWGGLSGKERRRVTLQRAAAAAVEAPQFRRGLKRCPGCDTYMATSNFAPNDTRYDGLHGECRQCAARRQRDRKQRQREAS